MTMAIPFCVKLTRVRTLLLVTFVLFLTTCFILNLVDIDENKDLDHSFGVRASRLRRFVYGRRLWPNATIPYVIDCSIANVPYAKEIIMAAMAEWEKKTCIRFIERTNEPGFLFIRRHRGCWGDVGYRRGRVIISVGDGCEFNYVMMHELGHAIGFYHEHNRKDRDSLVEVFWDNIVNSRANQFSKRQKMDTFEHKLPYDFNSIMHYRFVAFAKNKTLATLGLKDKNSTKQYVPYQTISALDARKAQAMYNCPVSNDSTLEEEITSNGIDVVNVVLKSTGVTKNKAKYSTASIIVNGKEIALNKRGINVVLVNYLSGKPTLTVAYSIKTTRAGLMFGRFIRNLPQRNYFLIVSKVLKFHNLRLAAPALRSIGFHPGRIEPGSSLCFVGYKGKEPIVVRQHISSPPKNETHLAMDIKVAQYYSCEDDLPNCAVRQRQGHCHKYARYLLKVCQKSCKTCKPGKPCKDENKRCAGWAKNNLCSTRPTYMLRKCKVSCGICRKALPAMKKVNAKATNVITGEHGKQTTINKTDSIRNETNDEEKPVARGIRCVDKSFECPRWQKDGRCTTDTWVQKNCLVSCPSAKYCAKEQIRPEGNCSEPFGIGWDRKLPDSAFNASSFLRTEGNWSAAPSNARLYMEDDHSALHLIGSWCSQEPPRKAEWLRIDLGQVKNISAVATQGRFRYYEHVKSYNLSFSIDGEKWEYYRDGGRVKVFEGNCDHITPVLNTLDHLVEARYVRFHPIQYYGLICMRVEVFGCDSITV